jgi:hypothetical protein
VSATVRRPRPPTEGRKPLAANPEPLMDLSSSRRRDAGISKRVASRHVRVLIVDDEPVARRVLREELELQPDVKVAAEADNGARALVNIKTLKPNVVLLDSQARLRRHGCVYPPPAGCLVHCSCQELPDAPPPF